MNYFSVLKSLDEQIVDVYNEEMDNLIAYVEKLLSKEIEDKYISISDRIVKTFRIVKSAVDMPEPLPVKVFVKKSHKDINGKLNIKNRTSYTVPGADNRILISIHSSHLRNKDIVRHELGHAMILMQAKKDQNEIKDNREHVIVAHQVKKGYAEYIQDPFEVKQIVSKFASWKKRTAEDF
jgi:hypothetical protein